VERIDTFHSKLQSYEANQSFSHKLLQHMMEVMVVMFEVVVAVIDIEFIKESWWMLINPVVFMNYVIISRLGTMLTIKENGKIVSVMQKLCYTPVQKKQLIKVRGDILNQYLLKFILICVVISMVTASIFWGKVTLFSIIYPIVLGVYGWAIGQYMIRT